MSLTGPDPATPTKTGIATADVLTGLHAALGILAALNARRDTGEGQLVEVNLMSSMLSGLVNFGGAYALTGDVDARDGASGTPGICPYEPFETKDRLLVIAAANDRLFALLCGAGTRRARDRPRFRTNGDRVANRDELGAPARRGAPHAYCGRVVHVADRRRRPCGPINDVAQGMELAASLGLDPIVDVDGSAQVAHPVRLSATPATYRHAPPALGSDQEVLAWLDQETAP